MSAQVWIVSCFSTISLLGEALYFQCYIWIGRGKYLQDRFICSSLSLLNHRLALVVIDDPKEPPASCTTASAEVITCILGTFAHAFSSKFCSVYIFKQFCQFQIDLMLIRYFLCRVPNSVAKAARTLCIATVDELRRHILGHVGYCNGQRQCSMPRTNQQPPAPISWFPPCHLQINKKWARDSY